MGVGNSVFSNCALLTQIELPNTVTTIGDNVFAGCVSLSRAILSSGIERIGVAEFMGCNALTSIVIPLSVASIGVSAFKDCTSLSSIVFPTNITSIEDAAFNGCALSSVYFLCPYSTTIFGNGVFDNGAVANVYYVGAAAASWSGVTTVCGSAVSQSELDMMAMKSVVNSSVDISSGVALLASLNTPAENIAATLTIKALEGNTTAYSILATQYPGSSFVLDPSVSASIVAALGPAASNISDITIAIPDASSNLPPLATTGATYYPIPSTPASYTISGGADTITVDVNGVYSLNGVAITSGNSVVINGVVGVALISSFVFSPTVIYSGTTVIASPDASGAIVIRSGTTAISTSAFENNTKITSITFNTDGALTSIGNRAFAFSSLSGTLTIPNSVTTIGYYAFSACSGLTGPLNIPTSVTTIGNATFHSCTGLTGNLIIPTSVTMIGIGAFQGCTGLTGPLIIPTSITWIGPYAFQGCTGLSGPLTIPDSVTLLGMYAFRGCTGLAGGLTIPNGVTFIGNSVFQDCSGLTGSLTIPAGVKTIGSSAFQGCSGLTGSLTIPTGVTNIGASAFQGCSGLSGMLVIPNLVTIIGASAFQGCSGLSGMEILGDGAKLLTLGSDLLTGNTNITFVSVPLRWKGPATFGPGGPPMVIQFVTPPNATAGASTLSSAAQAVYSGGTVDSSTSAGVAVAVVAAAGNPAIYQQLPPATTVVLSDQDAADFIAVYSANIPSSTLKSPVTIATPVSDTTGATAGVIPTPAASGSFFLAVSSAVGATYSYANSLDKLVVSGGVQTFVPGYAQSGPIILTVGKSYLHMYTDPVSGILTTTTLMVDALGSVAYTVRGIINVTAPSADFNLGDTVTVQWAASGVASTVKVSAFTLVPLTNSEYTYLMSPVECQASAQSFSWVSDTSFAFGGQSPYNPLPVWFVVTDSADSTICGTSSVRYMTDTTQPLSAPPSEEEIAEYFCRSAAGILNGTVGSATTSAYSTLAATFPGRSFALGSTLSASLLSWANPLTSGLTSINVVVPNGSSLPYPSDTTFFAIPGVAQTSGPDGLTVSVSPASYSFPGGETLSVDETGAYTLNGSPMVSGSSVTLNGVKGLAILYPFVFSPYQTYTLTNGMLSSVGKGTDTFVDLATIATSLGSTITGLAPNVFQACSNLRNIVIPDSVTTIGASAFNNCFNLTSITLGNGVTHLGAFAFAGCTSLASIVIPNSLTQIDESAFSGCAALTSVVVPPGTLTIAANTFKQCYGLLSITLPPSVTTIGESAFDFCGSLTALVIPPAVTNIAARTFYNCCNLTAINIPMGVTSIGISAFAKCSGIKTIVIPSRVSSIGANAFTDTYLDSVYFMCDYSTAVFDVFNDGSIVIPVFYYAPSVATSWGTLGSSVTINGSTIPVIMSIDASTLSLVITGSSNLATGVSTLVSANVPKSKIATVLVSIALGGNTTAYSTLAATYPGESILLDSTLTATLVSALGSYASGVTSITLAIPDASSVLPSLAATGVTYYSISSAPATYTISGSADTIVVDTAGGYSFNGVPITTGSTVTINGVTGNVLISSFVFIPYQTYAVDANGVLTSTGGGTDVNINLEQLGSTLGSPVYALGDNVFYSCTNLRTITYGDMIGSPTSVGASAFYNCINLQSVDLGTNLAAIGTRAFFGCSSLTGLTLSNAPNSITIGDEAFANCTSLRMITVPDMAPVNRRLSTTIPPNTTQLGEAVFSGCTGLLCATIPAGIHVVGTKLFLGCTGLAAVSLPNSLTGINDFAFSGCTSLTSIFIPSAVTTIGANAFANCSGLTSLVIPASVTSIGSQAFYGCSALTLVVIPPNVTSIGSGAFGSCANLTVVYYTCAYNTAVIRNGVFNDGAVTNIYYTPSVFGSWSGITTACGSPVSLQNLDGVDISNIIAMLNNGPLASGLNPNPYYNSVDLGSGVLALQAAGVSDANIVFALVNIALDGNIDAYTALPSVNPNFGDAYTLDATRSAMIAAKLSPVATGATSISIGIPKPAQNGQYSLPSPDPNSAMFYAIMPIGDQSLTVIGGADTIVYSAIYNGFYIGDPFSGGSPLSSGSSVTLSGVTGQVFVPTQSTPGQPTNVVIARSTNSSVTVTWAAPAYTGGSFVTDYTVEISPAQSPSSTILYMGTSATIGGLTPGVSYTFRVAAQNANGYSEIANPLLYIVPVAANSELFVRANGYLSGSSSVAAASTSSEVVAVVLAAAYDSTLYTHMTAQTTTLSDADSVALATALSALPGRTTGTIATPVTVVVPSAGGQLPFPTGSGSYFAAVTTSVNATYTYARSADTLVVSGGVQTFYPGGTGTGTVLSLGTSYTVTPTTGTPVPLTVNYLGSSSSSVVTPPPAPTGLTASSDNAQLTVTWAAPTGSPPDNYAIDYTVTPVDTTRNTTYNITGISGAATSYTITGLTNYTFLTVILYAVNGGTAKSAGVTVPARSGAVLPIPKNLVAVENPDHSMTISWDPLPAPTADPTGVVPLSEIQDTFNNSANLFYSITVYDSSTNLDIGNPQPSFLTTPITLNNSSATIKSLYYGGGRSYKFAVRIQGWQRYAADNGVQATGKLSALSNSIAHSSTPYISLSSSGVLATYVANAFVATAGPGSATISAAAATVINDGGSSITEYAILNGTTVVATGPSLPITVTGLTLGQSYAFNIRVTNAIGSITFVKGGRAGQVSVNNVTPLAAVPDSPTNVGVTAVSAASVSVAWTAPTSNGGAAITSYVVTVSPAASATITYSGLTATVSGLTSGTAYTFAVAAMNSTGQGATSTPSSPCIIPSADPTATILNSIVSGANSYVTAPATVATADITQPTVLASIILAASQTPSIYTSLQPQTTTLSDADSVALATALSALPGRTTGTIATPVTVVVPSAGGQLPFPTGSGSYFAAVSTSVNATYTYAGSADTLVVSGGVQTFYPGGTGTGTVLSLGTSYTVKPTTGTPVPLTVNYLGSSSSSPAQIQNVVATEGANSVIVKWDPVLGTTSYYVFAYDTSDNYVTSYSASIGISPTVSIFNNTDTIVIKTLGGGFSYKFKVGFLSSTPTSDFSNIIYHYSSPYVVAASYPTNVFIPLVAASFTYTVTSPLVGSVNLIPSSMIMNGGYDPANISYNFPAGSSSNTGVTLPVSITAGTNNSTIFIINTIYLTNPSGTTVINNPSRALKMNIDYVQSAPAPPINLAISSPYSMTDTSLTLTWTQPPYSLFGRVYGYDVSVVPAAGTTATVSFSPFSGGSAVITGLVPGTIYNFSVASTNTAGKGNVATVSNAPPIQYVLLPTNATPEQKTIVTNANALISSANQYLAGTTTVSLAAAFLAVSVYPVLYGKLSSFLSANIWTTSSGLLSVDDSNALIMALRNAAPACINPDPITVPIFIDIPHPLNSSNPNPSYYFDTAVPSTGPFSYFMAIDPNAKSDFVVSVGGSDNNYIYCTNGVFGPNVTSGYNGPVVCPFRLGSVIQNLQVQHIFSPTIDYIVQWPPAPTGKLVSAAVNNLVSSANSYVSDPTTVATADITQPTVLASIVLAASQNPDIYASLQKTTAVATTLSDTDSTALATALASFPPSRTTGNIATPITVATPSSTNELPLPTGSGSYFAAIPTNVNATYTYAGSADTLVVSGGVQTFYPGGTGTGIVLDLGTVYTITPLSGPPIPLQMTYKGSGSYNFLTLTSTSDPADLTSATVTWGNLSPYQFAYYYNEQLVLRALLSSTDTSYRVNGLGAGKTYKFVLTLENNVTLTGYYSTLAFSDDNTGSSVVVTWEPPPGATSYDLTVTGDSGTQLISPVTPGELVSDLYYNKMYTFTLTIKYNIDAQPTTVVATYTTGPCFLADAPVLTPAGYRPIASLRVGDLVQTATGAPMPIVSIKKIRALPTPDALPYLIPAGLYGATQDLPISPHHLVRQPGKEARHLGLAHHPMTEPWDYYNLELTNHTADMVVAGVVVETWKPWDGVERTG